MIVMACEFVSVHVRQEDLKMVPASCLSLHRQEGLRGGAPHNFKASRADGWGPQSFSFEKHGVLTTADVPCQKAYETP